MQAHRLEIALMGLLFALSAGCTPGSAPRSTVTPGAMTTRPAAAPADRLTRSLEEAAPGEAFVVADGPGGKPLHVLVEREYHAASGRLCRRLRVDQAERVACRDPVGLWRLLPPLANRALPALVAGHPAAGEP